MNKQISQKSILLSIERFLDSADVLDSRSTITRQDLEAQLHVTSNRSAELARALLRVGLASPVDSQLTRTHMLNEFIDAWEVADAETLSRILEQFGAYEACLRYLERYRICPLVKGAPPWIVKVGSWRRGRDGRSELKERVGALLGTIGLACPDGWESFTSSLIDWREDKNARPLLSEVHLIPDDPQFRHTAGYFFQWLTMPDFGVNPAAFDQMALWTHALGKTYKITELMYWAGATPLTELFDEVIDETLSRLSMPGEFSSVGLLWDSVCKALHISANLFETMMLDYINQHARKITISGAVGLERRGLGVVFYDLKPRSAGPPWFERRWLADGLRTPQGNIKFVRLEH